MESVLSTHKFPIYAMHEKRYELGIVIGIALASRDVHDYLMSNALPLAVWFDSF